MAPLQGLRVLDLTRLLPGAVATQHLSDHGADVIKIEQPGEGDYARTLSPAVFARTNAGKRSVAIDLKHPEGKRVLESLAATADILVEGFRPGVMHRLGLDYETLRLANNSLIYVSLTGYGQIGPYADLAGHDINYIALGGLLNLNLPVIPGVQIGDLVGGSMQAVIGVLMALQARQRSGVGRHVDVSMTAGVQALLAIPLAEYERTGREPQAGREMLSGRYACYNVYQAKDGRWLAVGALESKFWANLCKQLDCMELIPLQFDDARQPELKARLAGIFATRDADTWFNQLRQTDCCVTPVRTVAEVYVPSEDPRRPPEIGEHTAELLAKSAYSETEIQRLKNIGAVA